MIGAKDDLLGAEDTTAIDHFRFSPSGRPSIRDGWLISERKIAALPKRLRFGESVEFSGPFSKRGLIIHLGSPERSEHYQTV